jgi:hypothetical protein
MNQSRRGSNAGAATGQTCHEEQSCPRPLLAALTTPARATTDICAVVLNTPDGFLALREGPGTQFRIKDKLRPSQTVVIHSEDCIWHRHGNVTCSKWVKVFHVGDQIGWAGWVRSKYLQPITAESC